MQYALKPLWLLCTFRGSPSQLQGSGQEVALLAILLLAITAVPVLLAGSVSGFVGALIFRLVLEAAFAIVIFLILNKRGVPERLVKTLSSYFGTCVIILLICNISALFIPGDMVNIVAAVWVVCVTGYILQQAIEAKNVFLCILGVFVVKLLISLLVALFFTSPTPI